MDGFNTIVSFWDGLFSGANLLLVSGRVIQENFNTPPEHTPGNPPSQLWKESLYSLLVKVKGCVPKVCWNNLRGKWTQILPHLSPASNEWWCCFQLSRTLMTFTPMSNTPMGFTKTSFGKTWHGHGGFRTFNIDVYKYLWILLESPWITRTFEVLGTFHCIKSQSV